MDTRRIPSADGKSQLYVLVARPEGDVRAALQIIHGFAEHVNRYQELIQFFTEHGFLVFGDDHIGHGHTARDHEHLSDFGSYEALEPLLQDEIHLAHTIKGELPPGTPLYVMGHSMGSLMTRALLYREPRLYDKAVIMGTGDMSSFLTTVLSALMGLMKLTGDGSRKSAFLNNLGIDSNNAKFKPTRTSADWISRNTDNVDRYMADPLSGQPGSVHTFYVMNLLMKEICKENHLQKMRKDLPVFFVSGAEDAFGEFGDGPRRVADLFRRVGMEDVREKYYPKARHEILNEDCGGEVMADLLAFYRG